MRKFSNSRNPGFTFVELIIVILLVGIMSVLVLPKFSSQNKTSAFLAADMAAADIRAVQHAAMYGGCSRSIIFGGNSYTAYGLTPEDRSLPGGATADPYSIIFNSLGEPDQGGSFDIDCGADSRTLNVEALTGKVTIN